MHRINQGLLEDTRLALEEVARNRPPPLQPLQELEPGELLAVLGPDEEGDYERIKRAEQACGAAEAFLGVLDGRSDELFGYNLLMFHGPERCPEATLKRMREKLAAMEEEGEIWLDDRVRSFLAGSSLLDEDAGQWRLRRSSLRPVTREIRQILFSPPRVTRRVLKALRAQPPEGAAASGVLITGAVKMERALLVDTVLRHFLAAKPHLGIPRLFCLFNRRSILHPFLNSIDPAFLPEVPRFLKSHERRVWEGIQGILGYVKSGGELFPDCLDRDFYLAYTLFLLASFRRLEANGLPPLLVCESPERFHPEGLRRLAMILRDFTAAHPLLLLAASAERQLPQELAFLPVHRIALAPLTVKEISELAEGLFPGVVIPRPGLQRIRRHSRGRLVAAFHHLSNLKLAGTISSEAGRWRWMDAAQAAAEAEAEAAGEAAAEGEAPSQVFLTALPVELKRLLYAVYLQAGLLAREHFQEFLSTLGLNRRMIERSLTLLAQVGLIRWGDYLLPYHPALQPVLKQQLSGEAEQLESRFRAFIRELWKERKYFNLVLLHHFFKRSGESETALEVLDHLLRRKLAERDLRGVGAFLDSLAREAGPPPAERERLEMEGIAAASRLRCSLLAGDFRGMEQLYPVVVRLAGSAARDPLKGELAVQIARYHESRGEIPPALEWAKKALILCQQSKAASGEYRAVLELGAVMLADGRLEEALGYLSIPRPSAETAAVADELRGLAIYAAALFLRGNLSMALAIVEKLAAAAEGAMNREWELYALFLKGRILFELGSGEEALASLGEALTLAGIYGLEEAVGVVQAWMGRAFAYLGSPETAIRMFAELEESFEVLFFTAEARFLQDEYAAALESLELALRRSAEDRSFPAERCIWRDGFAAIEGRCYALIRDNALLLRLIRSFQAYLWGRTGNISAGIQQLHALTRGEKLPEIDPYLSLYHFFYASTLPEVALVDMDDRMTVLSKSVKVLHQRGSYIQDSTLRYRFLHNNYWNGAILKEAQNKKLI